jgi:hypothetical protein
MLAKTRAVAGRRTEALQAARDALTIFETKGDKANTERAQELVASMSEGPAA